MDFGRAFTFINEDENWINKMAIGGVIMLASMFLLFPIVLLLGYQLAVMRNVMAGEKRPLPEWNDFGRFFTDGLYVTIAMLVYTLPIWLLFCAGFGFIFLPIIGGGNENVIGALFGVAFLAWFALACVAMAFGFLLLLITPAIYIQYVRTNEFGSMFRVGEIIAIVRSHIGDILIAVLAGLAANFAYSFALNILIATICGIVLAIPLMFVGPVWIMAALGHLYGQIAAKSEASSSSAKYAFG
jgi:hypothetical protein